MYGKPFVRAARDTWDLFTSQGFHLIINDDLTSGALFMGCVFGGLLTALVTGVYTYQVTESIAVAVSIIAFFVGYFLVSSFPIPALLKISILSSRHYLTNAFTPIPFSPLEQAYITMSVVESAVCSYYVCYAEDPVTLQRNDPAFYDAIRSRHTLLMQ